VLSKFLLYRMCYITIIGNETVENSVFYIFYCADLGFLSTPELKS